MTATVDGERVVEDKLLEGLVHPRDQLDKNSKNTNAEARGPPVIWH